MDNSINSNNIAVDKSKLFLAKRELLYPPIKTVQDEGIPRCSMEGPYSGFDHVSEKIIDRVERHRKFNINQVNDKMKWSKTFDVIIPKLKKKLETARRVLSSLINMSGLMNIKEKENDELFIKNFYSLSIKFSNAVKKMYSIINNNEVGNHKLFDIIKNEILQIQLIFLSIPRPEIDLDNIE